MMGKNVAKPKAHRHGPRKMAHRTAGIAEMSGISVSRLWYRNMRDLQAQFDRTFAASDKNTGHGMPITSRRAYVLTAYKAALGVNNG